MFIPNKPAKNGLKLVMACDVESKYLLNAIPYLGKSVNTASIVKEVGMGHYYAKELTKPYHHTGRNITYDNWFTSIPKANDLLDNCGLTSVGTLRQNKAEVPQQLKVTRSRDLGTVSYCYDTSLLASYIPPKKQTKKLVLLLLSMHSSPTISENSRHEVVNYYNSTKGDVDAFDQLCGTYTCSRRTKRWPLCVFYDIINAATINARIIHSENLERKGNKRTERRTFMANLTLALIAPWAEKRLNTPQMPRAVKQTISNLLGNTLEVDYRPPNQDTQRSRQRCSKCPRNKDRKTNIFCKTCKIPISKTH